MYFTIKKSYCTFFLLSLLIAISPEGHAEQMDKPAPLGGHSLCEASASTWIPCPDDSDATCLLVGDNEVGKKLFVFPFHDGRLDVEKRQELDTTPALSKIKDIEALTTLRSGEVLVYGSHSRNKRCELKKKRRRYSGLNIKGGEVIAGDIPFVKTKEKFDLFKSFPKMATGTLQHVRKAVQKGEEQANYGQCEAAFNIEGAVAVPDKAVPDSLNDNVWLGLRAPLVDHKAVLVRHKPGLKTLAFDAAHLIDLKKHGVRDLTYANGWVFVLSGPVEDNTEAPFKLWKFKANALEQVETINVELVLEDVPNSAEGLSIHGNEAIMLMDGGESKNSEKLCETDSTYIIKSMHKM